MTTPPALNISAALDAAYEHLAAGRLAAAEALCRQILGVSAREPDALHCLALVAFHVGRLDAAIELVRAAIASNPASAVYFNDLGSMLRTQGKNEVAIASFRQSLARDPTRAEVHYNLANALRGQRDLDAAASGYLAAIAAQADFVDAHFHLGNVLAEQGQVEAAADRFQATVEIRPDHAGAFYNLGNARTDQGRLDEAVAAYRRAITIDPGFWEAHSNLLWTLQYMDNVAPQAAFAEALRFAARHEAPLRVGWAPHPNPRDPSRRLRVGYVSADFRRHSVAYFAESLLEHHDRAQFELFCYYNNAGADAVTRRFIALADHWVPCRDLDDAALATRIRQDGIDILVDLAGHTAHHRLLAFARKPAPVQVTYLGYPATTGISAIDYRITDVHADPPEAGDAYYTERLVRLPETFLCYRPPETSMAVQATPALRNGYVTFGSFNALPKITPRVVALWSRILMTLPTAHIFLKSAGFERAETRERFLRMFESHGVVPGRITLAGKEASFDAHLFRYHQIDIGLDPFPYNGTTTTFEAMWMGVPTVTLRGDRHATRVGASLLANAGARELIAATEEAYLQIAAELAGDVAGLDSTRSRMRERLESSRLLDATGLARQIESAYRMMWHTWCNASA